MECTNLLSSRDPSIWDGIRGHYTNLRDCARGLVSEECGGNPVVFRK